MPKVLTPHTLTGLARMLAKHGRRAFVVSGTDFPTSTTTSRVVIQTRGIKGFSTVVRRGRKVTIATGANFGEVLRQVEGENGLLKQAISMMANPLVRNRVTVLQALDPESQYFDLATVLVTLGSKVRLQSVSGVRTMAISDFLVAAADGLNAGEFPAAIGFGTLEPKWSVGFFRVNPGGGKPSVSASVRMRLRRNVAMEPEIVVSSSTVIPVRCPAASKALSRRPLGDNNVKKAADIAAEEMLEFAEVEDDPYESSLIEVAVSRAIRRVNEVSRSV